jgi:hypothetical protein
MRIQDFKVVYICPDHNEKYHARKVHMDTMLAELGFKDIVHFKSGTEGYPKCLANANVDILTQYMNEPFLLLEDDVEFTGIDEFDFVHGADAIYFGLSTCGSHATLNYNDKDAVFTPYSANQARVQNMLGTHAILYISPAYKQAVINKLKDCKGHTDIEITRIQPNFRILANRRPSFFQSAKFNAPGHLDSYTNFVIDDKWLQKTSRLSYSVAKYLHHNRE